MAHTARALYWVGGAGTQTYTNPSNWSTSRGGSGGNGVGTPDVADTGYPDAGDFVYIIDGNSQIAGSDQSAIALGSFTLSFTPTTGPSVPPLTVGSSGSPLKIGLANGAAATTAGCHGDLYLGPVFGNSASSFQHNGFGNVFLSGVTSAGGGLIVGGPNAGKITIQSTYAGTMVLHALGATITVDASATSTTLSGTIDGGVVESYRSMTTADVAGRLSLRNQAAVSTSVTVRRGGMYAHQSTGTITLITVRDGGAATSVNGPGPFTVTNSTVFGGGSLFPGATNITYTNPTLTYGGAAQVRSGYYPD